MTEKRKANLRDIKILVLDVDGVLTDGTLIVNSDGSESKSFNALDGHGIKMWRREGLKVAFLSGRASAPTGHRAKQLDVEYVFEDCRDKLKTLKEFLVRTGFSAEQVAYVGDDLTDLPVIRHVGFGAAVANAVNEVKQYADYVTVNEGGKGAVREVIEYILKSTGKWQELTKRYLQ